MTQVTAAIVSPNGVTLVIDGQTTPITDSHPNYLEIRKLASMGKAGWTDIPNLLDLTTAIVNFGEGAVTVEDGVVLYKGVETHNAVTARILQMIEEGLGVTPLTNFLDNLMRNPSFRAVSELYGFLEVNDLPITEDGCFLAYKMVRDDFTDHRTGKFDYSVGSPAAEMPRNMVNENPDETCSAGLHVCAQGYLGFYGGSGGRTILVKVNPADVVAVPHDYDNAKMRVCRHETVREIDSDTRGFAFTSAVYDENAMNDDSTLVDDSTVMTHADAMTHFGIEAAALRKRLNRGVSAKRVFVSGVEMVQVIDPDADTDTNIDLDVVTPEAAMLTLGIDKDALRKRLNRGVTVKRVVVDGREMVKFLTGNE